MGIKLPKQFIVAIILALVVIVVMVSFLSKKSDISVPGIPGAEKKRFINYAVCAVARCTNGGCGNPQVDKICLVEEHDIFKGSKCKMWCNQTCPDEGSHCELEIELKEDIEILTTKTDVGWGSAFCDGRKKTVRNYKLESEFYTFASLPDWLCVHKCKVEWEWCMCDNEKGAGECPVYQAGGCGCIVNPLTSSYFCPTPKPNYCPTFAPILTPPPSVAGDKTIPGFYVTEDYADTYCTPKIERESLYDYSNGNYLADVLNKCKFNKNDNDKYKFSVKTYTCGWEGGALCTARGTGVYVLIEQIS